MRGEQGPLFGARRERPCDVTAERFAVLKKGKQTAFRRSDDLPSPHECLLRPMELGKRAAQRLLGFSERMRLALSAQVPEPHEHGAQG